MASVPPLYLLPSSQICRAWHRKSGSESPFWNVLEPSRIYDLPRNLNRNSTQTKWWSGVDPDKVLNFLVTKLKLIFSTTVKKDDIYASLSSRKVSLFFTCEKKDFFFHM
jgi:hypothetical protein